MKHVYLFTRSVGTFIVMMFSCLVPSGTQAQSLHSGSTGSGIHELAKTSAIAQRFFTGVAAGDDFGYSVASAGDVNGDGFDDVVVGAYQNDAGGANAGRAYIYFGGVTVDNFPDVVFTGAAAGDNFGMSVSSAGDVNGDGYADVMIGAYHNDAGGSNAGRAYIYFGGAAMDTTADVVLTGAAATDFFGYSVSTAGDVNGDGYSDVIVGAYCNDAAGSNAGRAYLYFGGALIDDVADVTLTGEAATDNFGYSVSGAGDVNGDGYSDVIVGAYGNDAGGLNCGRAYVFFGGATMDETADVTLTGAAASDYFGSCVSAAGDVNGDGYDDIVVGAYGNDAAGSNAGAAYVYLGGASMNNVADVMLTGVAASDNFGNSVGGCDINGDGYSDVIVGAYGNDAGGVTAGRAYVYCGGAVMDNTADVVFTGAAANDCFGNSVSRAGDVNGDGYDDLIVGAPYNAGGGTDAGRAYLYLNSLTGSDLPDDFFTGAAESDFFGRQVASAGDVNADGFDDIVIGASQNGANAGKAYIYFGGPEMDQTADIVLTGEASGDLFGYSVSGAGDLNADGFDDVIVGAYHNDAGGVDAGRAYIYYGGASMDATPDIVLTGAVAGDYFGCSVALAGDVNGDGHSDVIVGAYGNDAAGDFAGQAYIFYGGPLMDQAADVIFTGEAPNDMFGRAVACAGDVNGDGYSDVIVGAYGNDAGGAYAGRAYLFFGGPLMDETVDVVFTGAAAGDYFGAFLASAGDVNGDGYADVVVGAEYNDVAGEDAGIAYIYFGGASMDSTADITLTGAAAGEVFGCSVAGADVNGDGYSDVIVGSREDLVIGTAAGRADVYFGGAIMDGKIDVTLTGEAAGDCFGNSVASAGDVNADGCIDVIVAAWKNDAGGVDAGRAYLYISSSPPIVPRIAAASDVPYDQGGSITIRWVRSAYDARGISRVTSYLLERSAPPKYSGFAWEPIATIPAHHNPQYAYTASTLYDSCSGTSGTFFFRITALTSNVEEYWRSNIVSARSVDNLPPVAPGGASITSLPNGPVALQWNPNSTDPDVGHYTVYRATSSGVPLSGCAVMCTTTDTLAVDSSTTAGQQYYYRITAVDIHGNESAATAELSQVALAVQLTSLTATVAKGNSVFLQWNTATEEDNLGFEVQRLAQNAEEWVVLVFLEGARTSGTPHSYSYQDKGLQPGSYSYRLRQVRGDGSSAYTWAMSVEVTVPSQFSLAQNYPNPFNPSTTLEYDLPRETHVQLVVYDNLGREIRTLTDEVQPAGYYKVVFDASDLASGMYLYRLTAGGFTKVRKLLLIR